MPYQVRRSRWSLLFDLVFTCASLFPLLFVAIPINEYEMMGSSYIGFDCDGPDIFLMGIVLFGVVFTLASIIGAMCRCHGWGTLVSFCIFLFCVAVQWDDFQHNRAINATSYRCN